MRSEAAINEWKKLYATATRIKELKPWEQLWDMDLIAVRTSEDIEDTVFFCVLGRGGACYGISVYKGFEGLNGYMLNLSAEELGLSSGYIRANQKLLSCYWGNRDETSAKQREIIKELGYKYRGQNNWLYFMSYEPGYVPYNLDTDEVVQMTEYLEDFEIVFKEYMKKAAAVDFENGNIFCCTKKDGSYEYSVEPIPFAGYNIPVCDIPPEEKMVQELKLKPKTKNIYELDLIQFPGNINDKAFKKPALPMLIFIADAKSGMLISYEMTQPEQNIAIVVLLTLANLIDRYGRPREIRVSNPILLYQISKLCEYLDIECKHVHILPAINEAETMFGRFDI